MNFLKIIKILSAITITAVGLTACKDSPTKTDSKEIGVPENLNATQERNICKEQTLHENRNRRALRSRMPVALRKAFEAIDNGASKRDVFFSLWRNAWNDHALNTVMDDMDAGVAKGWILGRRARNADNANGVSIFSEIQNGKLIDGLDFDSGVIVVSIFGGVLLDVDLAKELPVLLDRQMNQLPPVKGDIIIVRMVAGLDSIIEPVGVFSAAELDDWKQLRDASNPAYRLAAVRLFVRLCSDTSQEGDFLAGLTGETDKHIAMIVMREILDLPDDLRKPLLRKLIERQTRLGNIDVAKEARKGLRRR
jgi:hypothetical protein